MEKREEFTKLGQCRVSVPSIMVRQNTAREKSIKLDCYLHWSNTSTVDVTVHRMPRVHADFATRAKARNRPSRAPQVQVSSTALDCANTALNLRFEFSMPLDQVQAKFADSKEDSFLDQDDPISHAQAHVHGQSLQVDSVASALDLRNDNEGIAGTMLERLEALATPVDKQQVGRETGPPTATYCEKESDEEKRSKSQKAEARRI